MTIKLSATNLSHITDDVAKPSYTQDDLTPGIVHVGVGNFHRAHQSLYLHRLFEKGLDRDWAIVGAGITQYDTAMRDKLAPQDWLTTVVELDPERLSAQVTGLLKVGITSMLKPAVLMSHIRIFSLMPVILNHQQPYLALS